MALTSYGDLKTAIANWLNRADLTARADDFAELGDAYIRREQKWDTRLYSVEHGGAYFSVATQGQALTAGVRTVRDLWPTSGADLRPLKQTSFAELRSLANGNLDATGTPRYYALLPPRDPQTAPPRLFLWPRPAGAYSIDFLYVNDVGKVSPSGNDLFLYAPDLYLFAALAESAPYLKHDERVAMWETKRDAALASLNKQAEDAMFGASLKRAHFPTTMS